MAIPRVRENIFWFIYLWCQCTNPFKHLCKLLLMQVPLYGALPWFNFTKPHSLGVLTLHWLQQGVKSESHWVEKQTLEVRLKNPKTNMLWVYSSVRTENMTKYAVYGPAALSDEAQQKADWATKCPAAHITYSSYIMRSLIKYINILKIVCMSFS